MSGIARTRWVAGFVLMAVALTACGDRGGGGGGGQATPSDPGITDTEIKLGGSYPFTGPVSSAGATGKAVEAYWRYVNEEKGGIRSADGKTRKVTWIAYDDAYTPARAVENAKRLVEQDQVFALFNTLGTPNNTAIWDYLNQQEVPQLFVYSGGDKFYSDIKGHPWTIGWQVPYPIESAIYVEWLKKERPGGAKVAILFQNDDFGKDYVSGFENAIKGSNIQVVARQSYEVTDPTVDSQVVNLAGSGADVFFMVTLSKFSAQAIKKVAETAWKPIRIVSNPSATIEGVMRPAGLENSKGVHSIAFFKDPSDPQLADDPAMKAYKERMAKYCAGCNPNDASPAAGFAVSEILEKALQGMRAPTRKAAMESVRNMKDVEIGMLLPGIKVTTGPDDGYPLEAAQMVQFDGATFQRLGSVIDVTGKRG